MTASFPNSVKDFSDKENGKKIYAAHVNELQDEVEAIETTLLAGTEGQVLTAGAGGVPGWETVEGGGSGDVLPVPDPLMYDLILSGTNTDADGTYIGSFMNGQYRYEREDNSDYNIAFSGVWSIYKVIDPFEGTKLYYYSAISRLPRPDLIPLDKWYNEQGGDQPPILTKTNGRENATNPSYVFKTDVDGKTLIWGFGS